MQDYKSLCAALTICLTGDGFVMQSSGVPSRGSRGEAPAKGLDFVPHRPQQFNRFYWF